LALVKALAPGQSSTVTAGSFVTYNITVVNQGGVPGANIEITDYLPTCMTLADGNWSAGANNTATTIIAGPIAPGQTITIPVTTQYTGGCSGSLTNFAEISDATDGNGDPVTDIDSTPDDDPDNDGPVTDNVTDNTNDDEDDHDPAVVEIEEIIEPDFDLALVKVLAPGQSSTVATGDLVVYNITVANQGGVSASNIETQYAGGCSGSLTNFAEISGASYR